MFRLTEKNTAFYSTCNNAYIEKSATSLLTVRRFIPDAELYIISRSIDDKKKKQLEHLNIKYIDIDLRDIFIRHWDYPVECYYIFAGPELLYKKGYKYSVYIDGDVICTNNPLQNVRHIKSIAGTFVGDCRGVIFDDLQAIRTHFKMNEKKISRLRIASAIVYYNNKKMKKVRLLEIAKKLFRECLDINCPRKGDDSLFTLMQLLYFKENEVKNLGINYDYFPNIFGEDLPNNLVFLHLVNNKPWVKYDKKTNPNIIKYINEWRNIYSKYFEPTWTNSYIAKSKKEQQRIVNEEYKWRLKNEKKGLILNEKKRKLNSTQKPLKVYVSSNRNLGIMNFGDELPKYIIPAIFGYRVEEQQKPEEVDILSVGSILYVLPNIKKGTYCWGSGFIEEEPIGDEKNSTKNANYAAVRGVLSLKRIKSTLNGKTIPLGDPGILISLIYPPSKKTNLIGIVPHYIDVDNRIVSKLRKDNRFLIIDPLETPEVVARQISSCKFIISSSLHGLIFADSYGIPNAHAVFSDKVYGGEYKFNDYDSGVGKKHIDIDINKITDNQYIEELIKDYNPITNLEKRQKALIDAFPYN